MELGTVLLSYLTSADLQRGLLYVNRLWRFRSLHILQARQVNIQVQLVHLYLGPFRPSNMLELVFSSKVELPADGLHGASQRPQDSRQSPQYTAGNSVRVSPLQPARPLPSTPTSVARATVCAPLPVSALVKAKEIAPGSDGAPTVPVLISPASRLLSKKKLREAALLAESQYNSIIECGVLQPSASPSVPPQRTFEQLSAFFGRHVEVYTAVNDPSSQILYRASALAEKFEYATNKVGMYLSRRRLLSGGIYQATGFRCKPPGRTGLKCGGYFLTIEACKEFENHFQYGGLTEEQRKERTALGGAAAAGEAGAATTPTAAMWMEEGADGEGSGSEDKAMREEGEGALHGQSLSSVVRDVSHSLTFSQPFSSRPSLKKRHMVEDSQRADDAAGDSDGTSAPHSRSYKRAKSDCSSDSGSGSGSGSGVDSNATMAGDASDGSGSDGALSNSSLGKRTGSASSEEAEDAGSPTQSPRSSKSSASSHSVGSSSHSSHRSAFKATSAYRQTSSNTQSSPSSLSSSSPPIALGGGNDSVSPPPSIPELSHLSSSSGHLGMLPQYGSTMGAMYQSAASPSSTSSSSSYPLSFSSFPPAPLFTPPPVSYVQSASSPPLAVSHQFNALSLSQQPPVVPLAYGSSWGLESAFTSALMQRPQTGVSGGGEVSVGSNGLLNINNLTLPQLQALLGVNGSAQSLMQQLSAQVQQTPQYSH